jgi:hypothetical protein
MFQAIEEVQKEYYDIHGRPAPYLIFFRNSSPGHVNCQPRLPWREVNWSRPILDVPYTSFDEYYRHESQHNRQYGWHLMIEYNAIAAQAIDTYNRRSAKISPPWSNKLPIYYINIFNSTVLRRDGHVGFQDCLHYSLPGPTDWWVHFWYSALIDLTQT